MSIFAMEYAWRQETKDLAAKLLLMKAANNADAEGHVRIDLAAYARWIPCSELEAAAALDMWAKAGVLVEVTYGPAEVRARFPLGDGGFGER